MAIAQSAGQIGFGAELRKQIIWKSGLRIGEEMPFKGNRKAHKLPMARRRVFSQRDLRGNAPKTRWGRFKTGCFNASGVSNSSA